MRTHRKWIGAAVVALIAGVAPGPVAADARPEPKREYGPASKPLPPGGSCRRGSVANGAGDRCVRKCRPGYELLEETRVARARTRCIPRRTSRLWYRAQLDAKYDSRLQSGGDTTEVTHSWRFSSNHAALLFRQCSALLPGTDTHRHDEAAVGLPDDAGRMPCARVGRAIGADLLEDVSFGFRGAAVGGPYSERRESINNLPVAWQVREANGTLHTVEAPCSRTFVDAKTGSGPIAWPATLSTIAQSARTAGLAVYGDGPPYVPGPATVTRNAVRCPAPPGAIDPLVGGREASSEPNGVGQLSGAGLADLFTPDVAGQFGKPVITASNTVRRTSGPLTQNATFTLTLTRCPDEGRRAEVC